MIALPRWAAPGLCFLVSFAACGGGTLPAVDAGDAGPVDAQRDPALLTPAHAAWDWDPAARVDPRGFCSARTPATTGTVLHVATTGADSPTCGTAASPCATVGSAFEKLTDGQGATIYLRGGTYPRAATPAPRIDSEVARRSGSSPANPIVITSYPSEWAVLQGPGAQTQMRAGVARLDHVNNVRISCLEMEEIGGLGVFLITTRGVELDHLRIHGSIGFEGGNNPSGISVNFDSTTVRIHHNEIFDVYGPGAVHNHMGVVVFDSNGVGGVEVDHNYVHRTGGGIRLKHAGPGRPPVTAFHHNVVQGCPEPTECSWGLSGAGAYLEVHHNVVFGTRHAFVAASDNVQSGGLVYNNTFVTASGFSMPSTDDPQTGSTSRFYNNVLAVAESGGSVNVNEAIPFVYGFDHNAYQRPRFEWAARYASLEAWTAASGFDAHSRLFALGLEAPAVVTELAATAASLRPAATGDDAAFLCTGGAGGALPTYLGAARCP